MIKAIIFDIGGVVVIEPHDSWKNIFSKLGPLVGISIDTLISKFKDNMVPLQTGKITLLDFYKNLIENTNRNDLTPEKLLRKHLELYKKLSGHYDTNLINLIQKLKQNFKVACFTNTEVEIAEFHRERGLFNYFHRVFISTEIGLRKPNPKAYEHVIKELGIKPAEGIFIDNNREYVDAAEKVGLRGIVYVNIQKLAKELSKQSIIVEDK